MAPTHHLHCTKVRGEEERRGREERGRERRNGKGRGGEKVVEGRNTVQVRSNKCTPHTMMYFIPTSI